MTISEAISKTDDLFFNSYLQEDKVGWLSRLDHIIMTQIITMHYGAENARFDGYDENTDPGTILLVPAPFDEIYLRWMEAQIHYHNGELDRYNAAITMYNTAYEAYENHYKRTHRPINAGCRFIF